MQPSKRRVSKLQVFESLGNNVRELLTEEAEEHDRGHRLTTSPARTTSTPHNKYEANVSLKSAVETFRECKSRRDNMAGKRS